MKAIEIERLINELLTCKAIIQRYLEINASGTPLIREETDRCQDLLSIENEV